MKVCLRIFAPVFTLLLTILSPGNIFDRTLSYAIAESADEQRPLMLLFTSESCESCRTLEAYLQKEEIMTSINAKYVAAHINIADFDGKACSQIYGVTQTPAIVIATPEGDILYRKEGQATSQDLDAILQGRFDQPVAHTETMAGSQLPAEPAARTGDFAVQLGFFSSHDNAVKLRDKAHDGGYGSAYIQDEQRDGQQYYRVLVGPYSDESKAQMAMARLDKDGFPVKLHVQKS